MLNSAIVCWVTLSLIQHAHGLVHGNLHLDDRPQPGLRRTEPSFLVDLGKYSPSRVDPEEFAVGSDEETGSYDEELAESLQLQSRTMRSPRRCIPHQQSCLGHQLPCCHRCDTCYCRFFNAFCYCRRIGQSCNHGRA